MENVNIVDNVTLYQSYQQSSWTRNKKLIEDMLWWYVNIASLIGIIFNFICIRKLARLKERQNHRALFCIGLSDLSTLVLVLIPNLAQLIENYHATLYTTAYCKVYMFLLHSLTSFATWCWLLLALLRYLAVLHPYIHFKFRNCNMWRVIAFMLTLCCGFEFWTLILTTSVKNDRNNITHCTIDENLISNEHFLNLNISEILLSYILPFSLIFIVDLSVFCRIYLCSPKTGLHKIISTGLAQSEYYGHGMAMIVPKTYAKRFSRRRQRTLLRLILLTALNLGLNLPNCIVRLLNSFDYTGSWLPDPYNRIVQKVTYALSYTHYALSYVYLQVLINSTKHNHSMKGKHRRLAGSLQNLTESAR